MNIYSYRDYRKLLRDRIEEWRSGLNHVSKRGIGRRLGYSSPSFYKETIEDGIRNITTETARRFASMLHFSNEETEFLVLLVEYNQSETLDEKRYFRSKLIQYWKKQTCEEHLIRSSEYGYMAQWYYPVIRELLPLCPGFGNRNADERAEIARKLRINIADDQVDDAIRHLESLKFIRKDSNGNYLKTEKALRAEKTRAAQWPLHRFMDFGKTIIASTDPKHRLLKASLLCLNEDTSEIVDKKIDDFCREVVDVAGADREDIDRLYVMNIQFFPLTKLPGEAQ